MMSARWMVRSSIEYVDGEDLASPLRRIGRLPDDKPLEIARKLCSGPAASHENGVLHLDLKPANVMLDVRGQGDEVRSGTPSYVSYEQLAGKEGAVRSDIYAFGLLRYELFTGMRPFEGKHHGRWRMRVSGAPSSTSATTPGTKASPRLRRWSASHRGPPLLVRQ